METDFTNCLSDWFRVEMRFMHPWLRAIQILFWSCLIIKRDLMNLGSHKIWYESKFTPGMLLLENASYTVWNSLPGPEWNNWISWCLVGSCWQKWAISKGYQGPHYHRGPTRSYKDHQYDCEQEGCPWWLYCGYDRSLEWDI